MSNKATEFRFRLGPDAATKLEIFDQSGVLITTVLDGHLPAGHHAVQWMPPEAHPGPGYHPPPITVAYILRFV